MISKRDIDGLPVKDARRNVRITITPDDVKKARRKKPNTCAIAQTCLRQPDVKEVRIHLSRAYMRKNGKEWERFLVPRTLRSEIIAFDRGGRFAPGEYVLYRPSKATKLGQQTGSSAGQTQPHSTRGKRKRRPHHVVTDVRSGPA